MAKITLESGKLFNLLDPDPELICREEIARVLAHTPRFQGRARFSFGRAWTVLDHLMLCGQLYRRDFHDQLDPVVDFHILVHDAHEAYTGDISRPLKEQVPVTLGNIEDALDHAIYRHFGMFRPAETKQKVVKRYDEQAFSTEYRQFFLDKAPEWLPWENGYPAARSIKLTAPPLVSLQHAWLLRLENTLKAIRRKTEGSSNGSQRILEQSPFLESSF